MISFEEKIAQHQLHLTRKPIEILQVNVGKLCNLACVHCHVEAGPNRTENMTLETAEAVVRFMDKVKVEKLDLTGGAPEMNPHFKFLVLEARKRGIHVMDRCNLTVFYVEGFSELPQFLAQNQVEVIASLPCYTKENVDKQRGKGVFGESIDALQMLNQLGYGKEGTGLELNLVYNPVGAYLPSEQTALEKDYKERLKEDFGIVFNHLYTITNMPIKRFATYLRHNKEYDSYMELLVNSFNPAIVDGLMCRDTLSVGYDGKLYDCDFNQMLEMQLGQSSKGSSLTIENVTQEGLLEQPILTGTHCFGCTAGAGSSCGGSLE